MKPAGAQTGAKGRNQIAAQQAFAKKELIAVMAGVALLLFLFLPSWTRGKGKSQRANCTVRLKHISLSFRLWAADHDDLFPMGYYINEQGNMLFDDATNSYVYFQVMSNQLHLPSILACPSDPQRKYATNFTTDFGPGRISYFLGLYADKRAPGSFLCGDRNISNGKPPVRGILDIGTNQTGVTWTEEMHDGKGSIAMADGSVRDLASKELRKALSETGLATNRLALP